MQFQSSKMQRNKIIFVFRQNNTETRNHFSVESQLSHALHSCFTLGDFCHSWCKDLISSATFIDLVTSHLFDLYLTRQVLRSQMSGSEGSMHVMDRRRKPEEKTQSCIYMIYFMTATF